MSIEDPYAALETQIRLAMLELQREIDLRDRIIHEYADHLGPSGITCPIIPAAVETIRSWLRARRPEAIVDTLKEIAALAPHQDDASGLLFEKHLRATGLARELLTSLGVAPAQSGL